MEPKTRSLLDQALSWMPGSQIARVEQWDPGWWRFWFDDRACIMTGGMWRVVEDGKIHTGSDDHGKKLSHRSSSINARESAERSLLAKKVKQYVVADGTLDIFVEFEGHTRLELINFSVIREIWEISGPNGEKIVGQPDGAPVIWRRRST